jgi:hypothetical protein
MVVTTVVTMAGVAGSVEVATEEGVIPAVMPAAVVRGVGVTAVAAEADAREAVARAGMAGTGGQMAAVTAVVGRDLEKEVATWATAGA